MPSLSPALEALRPTPARPERHPPQAAALPLDAPLAELTDRPWHCWQTSSLALVSLAAMEGAADETGTWGWWVPATPEQGLERLQRAAALLGWPCFATLQPRGGSRWLVLGASSDTTAVIQRDEHAPVELPLALRLRPLPGGGSTLRWQDDRVLAGHGLPPALIERVAALPRLLEQAWH